MSLGAGRGFSIANLCTGIQHIIIKLINTLNFQFGMKQKIGFPRVERCCPDQTNLPTKLVQILYVCLMNLCERTYAIKTISFMSNIMILNPLSLKISKIKNNL